MCKSFRIFTIWPVAHCRILFQCELFTHTYVSILMYIRELYCCLHIQEPSQTLWDYLTIIACCSLYLRLFVIFKIRAMADHLGQDSGNKFRWHLRTHSFTRSRGLDFWLLLVANRTWPVM